MDVTSRNKKRYASAGDRPNEASDFICDFVRRGQLIVVGLLISVYLLVGQHAQAICNLFLTVPAAIFTSQQISKGIGHPLEYKPILFYWTAYGIITSLDDFFSEIFGYFFGKFILMNTFLLYTMKKVEKIQQKRVKNALRDISPCFSRTSIDQKRSHSQWDSEKRELASVRSARTVSWVQISNTDISSIPDMTRSRPTLMKTLSKGTSVSLREVNDMNNYFLESSSTVNATVKSSQLESSTSSTEKSPSAGNGSKFEPSSALEPHAGQITFIDEITRQGDIKTTEGSDGYIEVSREKVMFSAPFKEPETLKITNWYKKSVMWALKTNAIGRIAAQPTCGVLRSGAGIHLILGLVADPPSPKSTVVDRLAIDYSIVDDSTIDFDRCFLHRHDPHRMSKRINITYN